MWVLGSKRGVGIYRVLPSPVLIENFIGPQLVSKAMQ
jgi:hypothetical protein